MQLHALRNSIFTKFKFTFIYFYLLLVSVNFKNKLVNQRFVQKHQLGWSLVASAHDIWFVYFGFIYKPLQTFPQPSLVQVHKVQCCIKRKARLEPKK